MYASFTYLNLISLYGGWVVYRNGEYLAASWPTKAEAVKWAKGFCELNGLRYGEGK